MTKGRSRITINYIKKIVIACVICVVGIVGTININADTKKVDIVVNKTKTIKVKKPSVKVKWTIKNKKIVNEKINILKLQIKDLNEIIEKKEALITEKIVELENQLFLVQSIAFGCSNAVLSKKNGNAFSYFFSPNDIPNDIMNKIKSSDTSAIESVSEFQKEAMLVNDSSLPVERPLFCRKCGYKLLAESTFCTKCGVKVE